MALTTVSSDRLSTNVKNTNFTSAEKQDLTNDILPLATQFGQSKNLILNGAFQIAQRGVSSNSSGYATVDRFEYRFGGTDEAPTQTQADITSGTPYELGFRKSYKIQNGNQTSGAGASDNIYLRQRLEAQVIANSGWHYDDSNSFVTLQFWVKSSVAQNFYGYLRSEDGTLLLYPFETGSLTADTWTKVTKTIAGNASLTFDNNNLLGLEVVIAPFWGTDFTGSVSLNAWGAYGSGATRAPDYGSANDDWYLTNNATFEITGVQLEVGSVATDFEHRSFGQELDLCQRYYFRIPYQGIASDGGVLIGTGKETGSSARVCVVFPQTMRAVPSCAASNLLADDESSATSANTINQVLASTTEPDRGRIQFTGGSYSSANSISLATGQATAAYLEGSAEL